MSILGSVEVPLEPQIGWKKVCRTQVEEVWRPAMTQSCSDMAFLVIFWMQIEMNLVSEHEQSNSETKICANNDFVTPYNVFTKFCLARKS